MVLLGSLSLVHLSADAVRLSWPLLTIWRVQHTAIAICECPNVDGHLNFWCYWWNWLYASRLYSGSDFWCVLYVLSWGLESSFDESCLDFQMLLLLMISEAGIFKALTFDITYAAQVG